MADDIASQLEGAVESLGRFRDSLEDNNIRLGNSASIEAKINKLEADKLKLLEKANKAEGKRMKDLASGMGKAAQSMGKLAMKLGVVGGILTMFKGVVDVLLKVDRHAAKFSKQLGETRSSAKGLFNEVTKVEGSLQAVGINLGEALHTAGALAQEFGQMSRVTSEMVDQTAKYSKAFGTSTEEAAKLTEHLTRSGVSMDFIDKGLKSAFLTGNNLGVVFRDLTKNAGMIELYLTRGEDSILDMANRAAALGGSLESFGKMADAWSDVESIGENIGKTAQLFGSAFEDGLGDLTELYTMYQNFQDDKLHERITEQLAKTMVLEGDILKIRKQQADGTFKTFNLTRAHVEQASKLYGGDKEFMMRSIKAQKQMEMTQKTMNLLDEEGKKLSLDKFMALQDAHRLATKGNKDAKALHELDKVGLENALKAAKKQMELKEEQVDEATKIENILSAQAGIWTKLLNLVKQVTEPLETVVSKLFDENVMEGLNKHLTTLSEKVKVIFSTGEGGAFNTDDISEELAKEDGGVGSALKLMGDRLATSFATQFDLKTKDGEVITSWKGLMTKGWDTLKDWLKTSEAWLIETFARIFKGATQKGLSDIPGLGYFTDALLAEEQVSTTGAAGALSTMELERGLRGEAGMGGAQLANTLDNIVQEATGGKLDVATTSFWGGTDRRLLDSMLELSKSNEEVTLSAQDLSQGYIDFKKAGFDEFDESVDKFILSQLESGKTFTEAIANLTFVGPQLPGSATGWAGGRHRGIVGEAGTEVGITRSALRELSSAGIPGYQSGLGTALTNRSGLTQSAGSVGGRAGRHESSRYEQARYQNSLNNFLRTQDDITRERHEIWAKDQKEFFTKYPAIVDEALGAPFRQGGPVVTGIYNSVFSGLQASTRAELAGASKSEQRQLMYQHMTAEGLKPGGIISQGMNWLGEKQSQLNKTFGEGFKKEEEKLDNMMEQEKTLLNKAAHARKLGDTAANKAAWEQIKLLRVGIETQEHQINELKELQKRGEGWNRATVGLLGGIQSGLAMAASVVASGGSKKQARKAAGTGLVAGLVKDLTGTFGTADKEFLGTFDTIGMLLGTKPMPSNIGGNASDIINRALSQTEQTFQGRGRGLGWGGGNSQGRVYNSPHLAVVGEGSQNEIIVPTERIRKGLPINEGVAKELASIGVPGYFTGGFWGGDQVDRGTRDVGMVGFGGQYAGGGTFIGGRGGAAIHNLKGAAGGGIATAGLSFANTLLQGGDMRQAAAQGIGAGVGYAASAALTPFLGPFAPLAGGLVGNLVGKGLGKLFAKKPKYKRYRNRAVKQLEDHVQSKGMFMWGQPGGVQDNLERAIAGKQRDKPSEKHYNRLKKKMLNSGVLGPYLTSGNIDPFIALMSGQMDTATGNQQYARFNNVFYGTPLAKGGIVTGPTQAVIGEKGPEAVIPLDQHGGYASRQQMQDQKDMISELKKQNQQMGMFIKNMGDAKTVLNVDGRQLAETVGQNMYDINTGI